VTIHLVAKSEVLVPEELVGKYVLADSGYLWASVMQPRFVAGVTGKRLAVLIPVRRWDDAEKAWFYDPVIDPEDPALERDDPWQVRKVRAVCDTIDEVRRLLLHARTFEKLHTAVIRDSRQALNDLAEQSRIKERDVEPTTGGMTP
jgi:hypothetical protein